LRNVSMLDRSRGDEDAAIAIHRFEASMMGATVHSQISRKPSDARSQVAVAMLGCSALLGSAASHAQSLDETIGAALQPAVPLTRGVSIPSGPKAAADREFVDQLRTRSIAIEPVAQPTASERDHVFAIASAKPAIDLEILFDYGSATIGAKAMPVLASLGRVLSKPEFKGAVFFINGHTDAKGAPDYNRRLSQRRAEAVRRALIVQYKIRPDTLIAVGFGKERLKTPGNPLGEENRRVQIVNTTVTAEK